MRRKRVIFKNYQLYLIFLIPFIYLMVFKYYPMLGAQIAFKKYRITQGIWGSPWIGFDHFKRFLNSYQFSRVMVNTIVISLYTLIVSFPLPIMLAIGLNYLRNERWKKVVQLVSYAPHFISAVVICGLILQFLNPRNGLIIKMITMLGFNEVDIMGKPEYFSSVYVWSGIWQNIGYSSIIYLAAIAGINPTLHEAAIVDGANVMQRIYHIDIPGILPTAIILLILNTGKILNVGFEKILLLQNDLNIRSSQVIDTYVYQVGIASNIPNYSFATAIGIFKSVIGLMLIITVNSIAKRVSETKLW